MNISQLVRQPRIFLLGLALTAGGAAGCQATIGGQTLPSAYYLKDDVQYFREGPEFKLTNTVKALDEYKLERQRLQSDLEAEQP